MGYLPSVFDSVLKYVLVVFIVVLGVIGLSLVHSLLLAFVAGINVGLPTDLRFSTLSITQTFDIAFRIVLFVTLIPIGVGVFVLSVVLNPIGQIFTKFGINVLIDIGNSLFQGFGWNVTKIVWVDINTSQWLPDFSTLVDQGIKILLGT